MRAGSADSFKHDSPPVSTITPINICYTQLLEAAMKIQYVNMKKLQQSQGTVAEIPFRSQNLMDQTAASEMTTDLCQDLYLTMPATTEQLFLLKLTLLCPPFEAKTKYKH